MTFNARMKSINLILTSVVIYGSDSGSFFVCVDVNALTQVDNVFQIL